MGPVPRLNGARSDRAGSQADQGQSQPDKATSQGNKGKGKHDLPSSQGKRDQVRLRQSGSHGNKGKGKQDHASSHPSPSQTQSMARLEQEVDPGRPGLANTQMGPSGLQANQASRPGGTFTPSNRDCNLYRGWGKPHPKSFSFSNISQSGTIVTIMNNGDLRNIRI